MAAKKTMPKASTPKATTNARSARALEHGAKAFAARYVREGLGTSPESDLALALGHPNYFFIEEGGPTGAAAAEATMKATDFGVRVWPREVANRSIRAFGTWTKPDDRKALVAAEGAPSEEEVVSIASKRSTNQFGWALLYLIEAAYGPELAGEAGLRALESKDAAFLERFANTGAGAVRALGYILRRLPEGPCAAGLTRLEALGKKWGAQKKGNDTSAAVRVVTGGRAGAEEAGYRPDGKGKPLAASSLEWVYDDAAFVADHVKRGGWDESAGPSVRMVVLGGDAVIDYYASIWPKLPAKLRKQAEAEFSLLAPSIVARITGKAK